MKAVVCGAGFGRVYLEALGLPGSPFELAGILAQGQQRSRACAMAYGVPLYTEVADLPDDVAVACVVVRSGVVGGAGGELAKRLLARGVHVLQEQPVHPDELAGCLRTARRHRVQYHVNPFYAHLAPVQSFLAAAHALLAQRPAIFLDAACAVQVSYPLVDLLGRILPRLRPWTFADPAPAPAGPRPYRTVEGLLADTPLTLRVQNELDPTDPDNHAHFLLRVTLGTEAGVLTLADTNGPVLWSPRMHVERDVDGAPHLPEVSAATTLVPAQGDILRRVWPEGVLQALTDLYTAIDTGPDPLAHGRYDLAAAQAWKAATSPLGPPALIRPVPPRPLPTDVLTVAILAVTSP